MLDLLRVELPRRDRHRDLQRLDAAAARVSIGRSVNVPLDRTRTALQPLNQPAYHFSIAIMWPFEVFPMIEMALPYSVVVQVRGSFASGVPLQPDRRGVLVAEVVADLVRDGAVEQRRR